MYQISFYNENDELLFSFCMVADNRQNLRKLLDRLMLHMHSFEYCNICPLAPDKENQFRMDWYDFA